MLDKPSQKNKKRSRQSYNIDVEKTLNWPGNVYWKNIEGIYLGCNDRQAEVVKLASRHEWAGRNIFDYLPKDLAHQINEVDNSIMQSGVGRCLLEQGPVQSGEIGYYLSIKYPLKNKKGDIVGLFGFSTELLGQDLKTAVNQLVTEGFSLPELPVLNPKSTKIKKAKLPTLSNREIQCLYYLVRGMTARQIGSSLNLSNRTVEFYLERIKVKLGCLSKSELIAKVLDEKIVER